MKNHASFIIALALCGAAQAAIEEVSPEKWVLYRGTSIVQPRVEHATKRLCQESAPASDVQYNCRGTVTFINRAEAPPPVCQAAPAARTQTAACPSPLTGSWAQTSSATVGPAPTCTVTWSAFAPTTPPAGACVSPPPPTGYDTVARIAAFNARLGAVRPGASWPIALPTAPTITQRRTVSTAAEMQAAMALDGIEVTFAGSGFVGTLNLAGRRDQRWIFPAGFTLTAPEGAVAIGAGRSQRVELVGTGGRVVGAFEAAYHSDMTMRGMDIRTRTNSSPQWIDQIQHNECSRVLIESTYLFARSYAVWSAGCNNVVIANSQLVGLGEHATARFERADLVLALDSRLVTQGTQMVYRAHQNTGRFGAWRVQFEGGLSGVYIAPAPTVMLNARDLVMLDSSIYSNSMAVNAPYLHTGVVNLERATVVGNRAFTNGESGLQIGLSAGPDWISGDNPREPYRAPPAWSAR